MVDTRFKHLKPGDKVRVSFTTTVTDRGYDPEDGSVNIDGYGWLFVDDFDDLAAEVIEPEYETHAFYLDSEGYLFRRTATNWANRQFEGSRVLRTPVLPMTKLVPEVSN
jgi:hypothetical protein